MSGFAARRLTDRENGGTLTVSASSVADGFRSFDVTYRPPAGRPPSGGLRKLTLRRPRRPAGSLYSIFIDPGGSEPIESGLDRGAAIELAGSLLAFGCGTRIWVTDETGLRAGYDLRKVDDDPAHWVWSRWQTGDPLNGHRLLSAAHAMQWVRREYGAEKHRLEWL